MVRKNVLALISECMEKEDEDPEKQTEFLYGIWLEAKKDKKSLKILNDALICVCGYSLDSLFEKPDDYF
ncbi:hypothetical protein HOV56_gp48 [Nitrosopumilus spindle-shaped virus]|uniref:Uncharacterized protein n=1 Tax=Nitrosopumilus spindle-shaped virus TaxID=2508184 RepID=A0A514K2W7_9VIRU|nr:hypothetical protein HOV56_gp48 [Nitrosopumilus spindle-shaped virus]YP_010772877.1 hypothetical protein QIT54_gp47 [Nitrosopumilus spindle-shaped virus]QDI73937.1 hypothetical protein [Nitrosopumilus spindle-shaped virus]QDI73985.1 hypothetical protein [Nitrosopumilus spindle-shaped virus]